MRVQEFKHNLVLAKPTEGYVRSKGLHASDIYGALYKKLDPKRYDKRDSKGKPLPMDDTKMEMGTAFEEVLEIALAHRIFGSRPGEFTSPDGVIFSPDYLFEEADETILGEFKCTWYSLRGAPTDPKFDKWLCQIKLYLHWLGLTKCRLYVLFVNGDYKPPSPQLKSWLLTFTEKELTKHHDMVMKFARKEGMIE